MNDIKIPKYQPLHFYTGSMFIPWNKILRHYKCIRLSDLLKKVSTSENAYFVREDFDSIKTIREILREDKIYDDIVCYRYMNKIGFKIFLKNEISTKVYIDYEILSTTLLSFSRGMHELKYHRGYSKLLKLNIPKGTAGIPVRYNKENSVLEEYEVVLDFGLKFRFKRKYFD